MRTLAGILLLAACAPGTPDSPTWLADVRPILAGNCIRCHGHPAIGGAPATFRLDLYDDGFQDGQLVRGARAMAGFVAARASAREDMPPRGTELSGRQKDILSAWALAPERGERPANTPPTAVATELQTTAEDVVLEVARRTACRRDGWRLNRGSCEQQVKMCRPS
jgi:hypothetical protein